ncbi:MAG: radical SAM family heme chaperone HemW [Acidimicrobiaceae bacterium]|nr:radical SAM family heme chaperone HemW [Acidimicrobiaceae bacterium]
MSFGVYVHVPFCRRRCDYCAFATWTDRHHLVEPYVAACQQELASGSLPEASSVYFGGGTPSLLPVDLLAALLASVPRVPGAEVTVECNPETVDEARLRAYRDAGVTRLSFGVQSMVPSVLAALGREHDVAAVHRAVAAASGAGFAGAYSVDLIFGAAGETTADWRRSLSAVLALDPPPAHVSAYGLTVEPGTPLARDPRRHPDPDDEADKYLLADDVLGEAGFEWYEVSNWARPGAECRHNQLYWAQGAYRGIGCAAHSHAPAPGGGSRRWWNVRTPDRYIGLVGSGASPEGGCEALDAAARHLEGLQLALRTRTGVPASALPEDDPAVEGLVVRAGGRAVLTLAGRLLANEVALRLVA